MADPIEVPEALMDALRAAQARGVLPTTLGTAELRDLGEQVLSRAVFTARGSSAVFVDAIQRVITEVAAGRMDDATARVTLLEAIRATGYTPEGGFPDAPQGTVPPALAGTLQDLSSRRRLDLIVETQRGLMIGAGQKLRGAVPERLSQFPAWELVRQLTVQVPRDWQARWKIAGGTLRKGRMVALKGDPIWGELGSWQNFDDALGVDHPPFAFNSGMGWREISRSQAEALGVTGPDGETIDDFLKSQPMTLDGRQPLPAPMLSVRDMDPALRAELVRQTGAVVDADGMATTPDGAARLAERAADREARRAARLAEAERRSLK